jgi:two-component system chemotaxis sensor kinase CheA
MPAATMSVRVDVEKVDRLVNLVGELVINQAMLIQLGGALPPDMCPGLINGLETLSQHLRELQEGVMAIRTQPVKSVFSRMPRLVRELSAQLGKEARLYITGEGTEIDKTVIEQLADPLTHLLRNAIDHGIEKPEIRVAQGKPPQGSIHLSAEHRSGRIVIEVSDDGRGIDRERVLARARQRGLVAADDTPSEETIDNLIFLPGFSTAEVVSNVSGRGVGMDVVRRNIQALGGRISLQSRFGAGSRFLLSLPLTLAIMDGMIVAVGRESYIVPLTNIVESLRPRRQDIHAVAGCGNVVAIRGEYVPLLYLAAHLGVPGAVTDAALGIVVVVENEGAGQVGLVVDELVGQQQVVVKSLEANYGDVEGIGGATILGNGRVALILDVAGLHRPSAPRGGSARQFGHAASPIMQ